MTEDEAAALEYDWRGFWARPKQLAPDGDWRVWVLRAGRGFGKTRSVTGFLHERAMAHNGRWLALIARTPADARDYNIEGPGGILRNVMPNERPHYEPSKRRLTWPNRSWATIYSDEEPDQLRGFSGDTAVLDEFAKYKHARDTWDMLQFGMRERSADRPRIMIATTPRPLVIMREIEAMPKTIIVTGSSFENAANLDQRWFDETLAPYIGTRLGRQEIDAEYIDDIPGALFTRQNIDHNRLAVNSDLPQMARIVVAVDPSGTDAEDNGDEIGIIVAGRGADGRAYVIADYSERLSPTQWGSRVARAYHQHNADAIVAESNYGGEMVRYVIRTVDKNARVILVSATRGKVVRAEPVASLYEQGRVHHVGAFGKLEDQLCSFATSGYSGRGSPDRADALVWAVTELMLKSEMRTTARYIPGHV